MTTCESTSSEADRAVLGKLLAESRMIHELKVITDTLGAQRLSTDAHSATLVTSTVCTTVVIVLTI